MPARSPSFQLPAPFHAEWVRSLAAWDRDEGTKRLFSGDASLWSGRDESRWLGWLDLPERELEHAGELLEWQNAAVREGVASVVVLGMGGSSLAAEVWRNAFGILPGHPELLVLDSTDPAQVHAVDQRVDPARSWFIVASKSGSTLEPNLFEAFFFERARSVLGAAEAGKRFFAITDPGSSLERVATEKRYRHVFHGVSSVGGRYSALSPFGVVPAALMGVDVSRLLERAQAMRQACAPGVPAPENPGVALGIALGVLARHRIDKLTLLTTSPGDLGPWLEQLVAESTGKEGKGIIPVYGEPLGAPVPIGEDRVVVDTRPATDESAIVARSVEEWARAGRPAIRLPIADRSELAAEMYRWEIATAVAGSVLGIHPFDQPDVEASKVATRRLTDEYEHRGALAEETPFFEERGIRLFADARNLAALGRPDTLVSALRAHFARLAARDYFALLAYVAMTPEHERPLQEMRRCVRDARGVATCLGFGPRFLHSTGQAYKGGPNTGVFLQITADDGADLAVPGRRATFGVVKAAQARGDFAVLAERDRRALRVHLPAKVIDGLRVLAEALREALEG